MRRGRTTQEVEGGFPANYPPTIWTDFLPTNTFTNVVYRQNCHVLLPSGISGQPTFGLPARVDAAWAV